MHKERIIYNGRELELDTFDTVIDLNSSTQQILEQIGKLLDEDKLFNSAPRILSTCQPANHNTSLES